MLLQKVFTLPNFNLWNSIIFIGAWVLKPSFFYDSFEFGDWVAERDFEVEDFPSKQQREAEYVS